MQENKITTSANETLPRSILTEVRLQNSRSEEKLRQYVELVPNNFKEALDEMTDQVVASDAEYLVLLRHAEKHLPSLHQRYSDLRNILRLGSEILWKNNSRSNSGLKAEIAQINFSQFGMDTLRNLMIQSIYQKGSKASLETRLNQLATPRELFRVVMSNEVPATFITDIEDILFVMKQYIVGVKTDQLAAEQDLNDEGTFACRAYALLRFNKQNLESENDQQTFDPSILLDMVEGRFEWFDEVILLTETEQKNIEVPHKKTLKRIRKLLVTVILTSMVNNYFGDVLFTLPPPPPAQNDTSDAEPEPDELGETESANESGEQQATPEPQSDGGEGEGSSSGEGQTNGTEDLPPQDDGFLRPENSGTLQDNIVWRIEGEIPEGYFKTTEYSIIDAYMNWSSVGFSGGILVSDGETSLIGATGVTVVGNEITISSQPATSRLTATLIDTRTFVLPLTDGYEVVSITIPEEAVGYQIIRLQNGMIRIEWPVQLEIVPDQLTYGIAPIDDEDRTNNQNTPRESDRETMYLLGDLSEFDPAFVERLNSIRDSQMSDSEKASAVRDLVWGSGATYGLDSSYTNLYLAEQRRRPGGYVAALMENLLGDCDVWNTAGVAFMRYVGLSARLASGFANGSVLDGDPSTLSTAQAHGWAIYWDTETNTWKIMDFTPQSFDFFDLKKIWEAIKNFSLDDLGQDILSLPNLFRSILMRLNHLNLSSGGWSERLTQFLVIYSLFFVINSGRQIKKHQKIREDIRLVERTNLYNKLSRKIIKQNTTMVDQVLRDEFASVEEKMFKDTRERGVSQQVRRFIESLLTTRANKKSNEIAATLHNFAETLADRVPTSDDRLTYESFLTSVLNSSTEKTVDKILEANTEWDGENLNWFNDTQRKILRKYITEDMRVQYFSVSFEKLFRLSKNDYETFMELFFNAAYRHYLSHFRETLRNIIDDEILENERDRKYIGKSVSLWIKEKIAYSFLGRRANITNRVQRSILGDDISRVVTQRPLTKEEYLFALEENNGLVPAHLFWQAKSIVSRARFEALNQDKTTQPD